jgi:hypothetical protein
LRKLALFVSACTLVVSATWARAQQQIDIAVGASRLFSSKPLNSSLAFAPPELSGGIYPGGSVQVLFSNHFGFNVEGSYRYNDDVYNGYQRFRPTFFEANGVYAARVSNRIRADAMAGVGDETVLFYNQFGSCSPIYGGDCHANANSSHFLVHVGGDLRYYFFRRVFLRPEVHYYHIVNNTSIFSSDNVLRLGASIGFSLSRQ